MRLDHLRLKVNFPILGLTLCLFFFQNLLWDCGCGTPGLKRTINTVRSTRFEFSSGKSNWYLKCFSGKFSYQFSVQTNWTRGLNSVLTNRSGIYNAFQANVSVNFQFKRTEHEVWFPFRRNEIVFSKLFRQMVLWVFSSNELKSHLRGLIWVQTNRNSVNSEFTRPEIAPTRFELSLDEPKDF